MTINTRDPCRAADMAKGLPDPGEVHQMLKDLDAYKGPQTPDYPAETDDLQHSSSSRSSKRP